MIEQAPEHTTAVELDLQSPEWTERLANAPIYAKNVRVRIRRANPGEQIVTSVSDGTEEAVNTAKQNDVVITNPGGEEYILAGKRAMAEYEPTEEEGTFKSKGMVRAVDNPTGKEVEIDAPWGSKEIDGEDCKIAAAFDPAQPEVLSENRYLIAGQEFRDTYIPVE